MKYLHYVLLPIVALAFASCSENLEEFESPKAELEGKFYKQYDITADCSFNDPETRAVLENDAKVNWEDIDKLIIWTGEARDGGNYTVSEANMGEFTRTIKNGVNTFYGYLQDTEAESEPADDTPLYAYVASEYIEPAYVESTNYYWDENDERVYPPKAFLGVDLSEQKGTMEDAIKHDLLWGTLPYSEFKNNAIPNVQFEHEMSIMKYTLTLEGAGNTTANIRLSGFGMANRVNFLINTGKGNDAAAQNSIYDMVLGDIMLKEVEVKNDVATIYVALYPSTFTEMQAFVTLANGWKATASVGGDFNNYPIEYALEAGKIYTASATVTPVEVPTIGYYYNSDGEYSANPQSNSIGIVFSNETTARDFADGFTHGYVMALQNANNNETLIWDNGRQYVFASSKNMPSRLNDAWYYDRDGRYETDLMIKFRSENGSNRCTIVNAANTYQPIENYQKPLGASDWFIPGLGQLREIVTNVGGVLENEDSGVSTIPRNFADNTPDLDNCLTWHTWGNGWNRADKNFDNSYVGIFLKNINNKLELAKQAGATINLFNNDEDFWATSEYSEMGAPVLNIHYEIDKKRIMDVGAHTVKSNQFVFLRPILAF